MQAYLSEPAIKTDILAQLQKHHDADQLVKDQYWQGGKGCAVGCTIYSGNHGEYETRFGIPRILARLEDRIFEGLPNAAAKEWPIRFMGAIAVGADLAGVWPKFAAWLLTDETYGVLQYAKTDEQRAIINEVATLYARGERDQATWQDVTRRARKISYAYAAAAAVAAAAAAYAAAVAARRRRRVAAPSSAAASAHTTARERHYLAQAEKLIALLQAA